MAFSSLISWMVAVFGTIVAGFIAERLRSKPNLLVYFPSYFAFNIQFKDNDSLTRVNTSNVVLHNAGGAPASNVTVIFNQPPISDGNMAIVPARDFEDKKLANGQYVLLLGTLAPGEICSINTFYYSESMRVESVRSDSAIVKNVPVNYQRQYPRWVELIVAVLMALGFGAVLFWAAKFGLLMWAVFTQIQA